MFKSWVTEAGERCRWRAYVSELDHAQLPQLTDAAVGSLGLQEELGQSHLLTAEQLPHDQIHSTARLERSSPPVTKINMALATNLVFFYHVLNTYFFCNRIVHTLIHCIYF